MAGVAEQFLTGERPIQHHGALISTGKRALALTQLGHGVLLATLLLVACASSPPPEAKAAEIERLQCDASGSADSDSELLRSVTVLGLRPLYAHMLTRNGSENRINGARLLLRPPNEVSADTLTRLLQCHAAGVLLGRISPAAVPDDPYWLADGWLDIDVRPEDGNYEVTLSADSVEDGIDILRRAHQYAENLTNAGIPVR